MKLVDFFSPFMSGVPRFQHTLGNENNLAVLPIISLGLVIHRYRLPSNLSARKMPRPLNHWSSICRPFLGAAICAAVRVKNRH
jgi:hypothetical protein